ncbi:protein PSK SIMULATOR 1 [Ricinus communis]|uniref:protein PSK SIMULATOR 1 n=1 Tax=Ricinus communis TaxID=3988 RepID=UPI00201B219C|nr:protein PSK SIMULATOR 1 [Ricinus communis]
MGGLCSKASASHTDNKRPENRNFSGHVDSSKNNSNNNKKNRDLQDHQPAAGEAAEVRESIENRSQDPKGSFSLDDFYDGIPRYPSLKSRSLRSGQSAVAKVSEVSSRLGRASIEVLDTLGSSMTNLNTNNGFASSGATKGNELTILAFEVANTIVKGSSLMYSLSKWSIRHLKEVVLPSEGVQNLISKDMDELLKIVEADKREELKIFSGEVVRFGNICKDLQWHNLDRYFEKMSKNVTQRQLKQEEAISVMELLMTLVQYTAELYHGLQVLDRIQQEYQRRLQEENNAVAGPKDDSLATLRTELKSQKKQVRNLKKKSLWSRSVEEVVEKLVDIVNFLLLEIHNNFGSADSNESVKSVNKHRRLGPAGLSLHYANVVVQIDTLVARSSSMPPSARDSLYQNLPPSVKSALRSKLHSFHVKEELTITEIKDEMEKTLQWLVPMSAKTAKAHHGFGWVGEWANTRSEANRKPAATTADIIRVETLHHADKDTTEAYILELILWLHHLAKKSKNGVNGGDKSPINSQISAPLEKVNQPLRLELPKAPALATEDQVLSQDVSKN